MQSLAATNSTLYVGGRFTRVNGVLKTGLAAVNAASGAVDTGFSNDLTGGIGVNGQLGVPQLKLTHDNSKLLVVHTGRQIAGQDRLGVGIIDTATKQLLPWRTRLWDENLARVGGVTRIAAADVAPDDSYFVVSSGSGGDAPPISDTAVAYPLNAASLQNDDVRRAVDLPALRPHLLGRDHRERGLRRRPLPVHRVADLLHRRALLPRARRTSATAPARASRATASATPSSVATTSPPSARPPARALEWNPTGGSNSFEGNKAMEATSRGLFIGGDGMFQGGVRTGRVAFYDFNTETFPAARPDTVIDTPDRGPRGRQQRAVHVHRAPRRSPPARSGGSRSRSRTATPASTSRTTAPRSRRSATPRTR